MSSFDADGGLTKASVRSWIFAFATCLLMLGVFALIKYGPPNFSGAAVSSVVEKDDDTETPKKRKRKWRKKRHKRVRKKRDIAEDEIVWDDYDDPGIELGDILSEPAEYEIEVAESEPVYVAPKSVYQPEGAYTATASYREPGASVSNATTVDMSKSGSNSALREDQVGKVLTIRRLMPCYTEYASKVPQMKGRVNLKLIIEKDGHVSLVKITKSQLRSKVVEKCLVGKIRRLKFPSAGNPTKMTQSFTFS